MFNVERIKEIVTGPIEPNVPNTLWIDTTNPESPVLKVVVNGAYRAMAGSSSGGDDSDKCLCNIVTVELGEDDYIPKIDTNLPVFSEELNSKVWEYLMDGKCVIYNFLKRQGFALESSYILPRAVISLPSIAPSNPIGFAICDIMGENGLFAVCCAPENYQDLKDYKPDVVA